MAVSVLNFFKSDIALSFKAHLPSVAVLNVAKVVLPSEVVDLFLMKQESGAS